MRLENKIAIVYGSGGAMGGTVARGFAREGARVFLAGRTRSKLDAVAEEIIAGGGEAETAELDAFDRNAVNNHVDEVVERAGSVDISFNAVGITAVQGKPLVDMSLEDFLAPITEAARTHFVTATAAARRMTAQGSGVIVMLSSSAARESRHRMGGFNLACASIEAFTRSLAGEVGSEGVRVVCLRPNFTPETTPGLGGGGSAVARRHAQRAPAALGRSCRCGRIRSFRRRGRDDRRSHEPHLRRDRGLEA